MERTIKVRDNAYCLSMAVDLRSATLENLIKENQKDIGPETITWLFNKNLRWARELSVGSCSNKAKYRQCEGGDSFSRFVKTYLTQTKYAADKLRSTMYRARCGY